MTYRSPLERSRHRRRWLVLLTTAAAVLLAVSLADFWIARTIRADDLVKLNSKDWYRTLRIVGSLWCWVLVMVVIALQDRAWHRALPTILAPVLGGLLAELMKRVLPRSRPFDVHGTLLPNYDWRPPFSGFINDYSLGLPSSHTAVAFAGCLMLAHWMPRARWVFYLLAVCCGLSRMVAGAHYASDVLVGAFLGYLGARIVTPRPAPTPRFG